MFDNDVCSVDELKSTIVKNLTKSWEESKRKEYQVISFQVDRGSEIAALTTILKEVKGAFEQIRADLSITLTDKSEEALDRLFPVLLSEGATRNYGLKEPVNGGENQWDCGNNSHFGREGSNERLYFNGIETESHCCTCKASLIRKVWLLASR